MIVYGLGRALDLEELSSSESPRAGRPWLKFDSFSTAWRAAAEEAETLPRRTATRKPKMLGKLPAGFCITLAACALLSVFWLLLLINVAALENDAWYFLLVGAAGMAQNAMLATAERRPKDRNLPLRLVDTIATSRAMDGLMDLEVTHSCGEHLLGEFFPGPLRGDEKSWWAGDRAAYDEKRTRERSERGPPRQLMPRYRLHTASVRRGSGTRRDADEEKAELMKRNGQASPAGGTRDAGGDRRDEGGNIDSPDGRSRPGKEEEAPSRAGSNGARASPPTCSECDVSDVSVASSAGRADAPGLASPLRGTHPRAAAGAESESKDMARLPFWT